MSAVLFCIILVLLVINMVQFLVGKNRKKQLKTEQERSVILGNAVDKLTKRAERLQKAMDGNLKAEEEADSERNELDQTGDSDLLDRANNLFVDLLPDDE